MKIFISSGVGVGNTILSAFDNALVNSGIHNFNLIPLSSIVPPKSEVIEVEKYLGDQNSFGNKLYVVIADNRSSEIGKFIGSGVGWYQFDDGRGFFVEHKVKEKSENAAKKELKRLISDSIKDMCLSRDIKFDINKLKYRLEFTEILNKPSCTIVAAIFKSEGWRNR